VASPTGDVRARGAPDDRVAAELQAGQFLEHPACLHVPDPGGPVHGATHQALAVGAEIELLDAVAMPAQGKDLLAGAVVPELDGAVVAGAGQERPIRAELDMIDPTEVTPQGDRFRRGLHVPNTNLVLAQGSGQ